MPIDRIYRDAMLVGTSATLQLLTGATLPDDVQGPPPPPRTLHNSPFWNFGLYKPQIKHIDQFRPSYYQFESTGLRRAKVPRNCKFTLGQIAVTWWMARFCCNVLSSMALLHTGTKTQVPCISKKFSRRLANFGAWQGSREYSKTTPWPPL